MGTVRLQLYNKCAVKIGGEVTRLVCQRQIKERSRSEIAEERNFVLAEEKYYRQ